jgi:RNA polymerase sigma-70 factor, ECF subfamily
MLVEVKDRDRAQPVEFDDFYAAEYPRIVALAYALTGDLGAAEDAAQDAFLAAHRDWQRIGRYDAPGAWVRRVVLNRSRSRYRRQGRERRALARLAASEPQGADAQYDESERFWRAVRTLSPKLARCVVLHYVDDLDATAIAAVLKLQPSTVRVHLHRARASLAQILELEEDG